MDAYDRANYGEDDPCFTLEKELCWVRCSRCPRKVQTPLPLGIITRQAMEKIGWALIDLLPVCSQHLVDSGVF